jgi:hypothetical protein
LEKALTSLFLILFLTVLIGCQSEDDGDVSTGTESDSSSTVVGNALIDIPSSLSASSSSSATESLYATSARILSSAPSTQDQPVWAVYEGIRQNIGAMEQWASMINTFTRAIYSVIGRADSGDWTNSDPGSDEPSRIVWGPDNVNGYDSKMELYFDGEKGFEAYLTVNESEKSAKGTYTWNFAIVPDEEDPSNDARIQCIFDSTATSGTKEMSIKVQNMNRSENSGPENAWLKVTQSDDNIITLWGNYYFPAMDWFSDSTGDSAQARNYVFAATGYDETGQSDELKNIAILQLALPSADSTADSYWTSDSVSAVFVEKLKEVWEADGLSVTSIASWTGLDLSGASTISDLSYAQVISILEWARDNSSATGADELSRLIYVTKLVNPAYFDSLGFEGTCYDPDDDGTCDQGTATTAPSGFDNLDIDAVANDVVTPATVKNLSVDFL